MLTVVLILTVLNLVVGLLALSSAGRTFIEREADRDAAIASHNAIVHQVNKLATNVGWCAEETQVLCTSFEMEREAKQ